MTGAEYGAGEPRHSRYRSAFVPLLIVIATYLVWALFQTSLLVRERNTLATVRTNQEKQMQDSQKLRANLDTLARETQLLANSGNPSALFIVDELRKRGITINPQAPPGTATINPTKPAAPAR
jgi:cytoskeletal protein RodZ